MKSVSPKESAQHLGNGTAKEPRPPTIVSPTPDIRANCLKYSARQQIFIIQLKPEQENRMQEALRSGAYSNSDDVMDRALELLHGQDKWSTANRQANSAKIRTGIRELDCREGIPEDRLDGFLAQLKAQPD